MPTELVVDDDHPEPITAHIVLPDNVKLQEGPDWTAHPAIVARISSTTVDGMTACIHIGTPGMAYIVATMVTTDGDKIIGQGQIHVNAGRARKIALAFDPNGGGHPQEAFYSE